MTAASNESVVLRFIDLWHQDQHAAFDQLLADDCVWEQSGMPICRGKAACLAMLDAWHVASEKRERSHGFRTRYRNVASTGDVVFVERVDEALHADGRVAISFPCVGLFVVREGAIVEWHDYFDASPHRALVERTVAHWQAAGWPHEP